MVLDSLDKMIFDGNNFGGRNFNSATLKEKKQIINQLNKEILKADENKRNILIKNFNINKSVNNKNFIYVSLKNSKNITIENTNIIKVIDSSKSKISLEKVKIEKLSLNIEINKINNLFLPENFNLFYCYGIPFILLLSSIMYLTYAEQLNLLYIFNKFSFDSIPLETDSAFFQIIKYYIPILFFSVLILLYIFKILLDGSTELISRILSPFVFLIYYSSYLLTLDLLFVFRYYLNLEIMTLLYIVFGCLNLFLYCRLRKINFTKKFIEYNRLSLLINLCFCLLVIFNIINTTISVSFVYFFILNFFLNLIIFKNNTSKNNNENFVLDSEIDLLEIRFYGDISKKSIPINTYLFSNVLVKNIKLYLNDNEINISTKEYIRNNKSSHKILKNLLRGINLFLCESIINKLYENNLLSKNDYKYISLFYKKSIYFNMNGTYKSYFKLYKQKLFYNISSIFKYGNFNFSTITKYLSVVLMLGAFCFFRENNMIISDNFVMSNTINNSYNAYCSEKENNCKEMDIYNSIYIPIKININKKDYGFYQYYFIINSTMLNFDFIDEWLKREVFKSKSVCKYSDFEFINCKSIIFYEKTKVKIPNFYLEYNSFLYTLGLLIPLENSQIKSFMPNNWFVEKLEFIYRIFGYILWAMLLSKLSFYIIHRRNENE